MVDTLKEAEDRIRIAMAPPQQKNGANFSPSINKMRKVSSQNGQLTAPRKQLNRAR